MTHRHLFICSLTLLLGTAVSLSASAQATQSQSRDGWLAWHGCWSAEGAPADESLCIVPDRSGVRMVTTQRGTILAESRVVADGVARTVRYGDCDGTELAYWSTDRKRVYLQSDLRCADGATRKASGMFAFIGATQWVSVQAVTTADQSATAAVRYTASEPTGAPAALSNALRNGRSASMAARTIAAAVDTAAITEVAGNLDANAVQEWLRLTGQPYQIASEAYADEVDAAGYTSALDMASRTATSITYVTPVIVHVAAKRAHVHKTFFFGGRYSGRYSPWGYDWYGWRVVHSPFLYVRSGPLIISTRFGRDYPTRIIRDHRANWWQPNWRDGRVTRSGYTRDRDRWQTSSQGRDSRSGRDGDRSRGAGSPRDGGGRNRRH